MASWRKLLPFVLAILFSGITYGQDHPPLAPEMDRISKEELDEIKDVCGLTAGTAEVREMREINPSGVPHSDEDAERQPSLSDRLYAGEDAVRGGFPSAVWLGFFRTGLLPGKRIYFCGGTLITRRHVLTASHCFDEPRFPHGWKLEVRIGGVCNGGEKCVSKLHTEDDMEEVLWDHVFWQSDYLKPGSHYNDLAIVQLKNPVNDSCQPITLIGWGKRVRPTEHGQPVTGPPQADWPGKNMYPSVLQKAVDGTRINLTQRDDPHKPYCALYGVACSSPDFSKAITDSEVVVPGSGDSGMGIYTLEDSRLLYKPRVVGVISGSMQRRAESRQKVLTWNAYHMELSYRYQELCYYLNLCIPPLTQEDVAGFPNLPGRHPVDVLKFDMRKACVPSLSQKCG